MPIDQEGEDEEEDEGEGDDRSLEEVLAERRRLEEDGSLQVYLPFIVIQGFIVYLKNLWSWGEGK